MNITFRTFASFKRNLKLNQYLLWWSKRTEEESRMLNRTPEFFKKNLLCAIFVFDRGTLISAAGLIPCLNRHKERMHEGNKLVVELISNFVLHGYRDSNLGTELVKRRLDFCKKNNLFPVSVTGSAEIQKIFTHVAIPMENNGHDHIYREVRVCECSEEEKPCKVCPLKDRAIWVFKGF